MRKHQIIAIKVLSSQHLAKSKPFQQNQMKFRRIFWEPLVSKNILRRKQEIKIFYKKLFSKEMKLFNDVCVVPQKNHTPLIVCYEPKG